MHAALAPDSTHHLVLSCRVPRVRPVHPLQGGFYTQIHRTTQISDCLALWPVRPPTASEAHPLVTGHAQGRPLGPITEALAAQMAQTRLCRCFEKVTDRADPDPIQAAAAWAS